MSSSKPFITSGSVGAAGELAFRSQVLLRGYEVWIPQVDTGVDVLVNGHGVQVKSAMFSSRRKLFTFSLAKGRASYKAQAETGWSCLGDGVEYVALVGIIPEGGFAFWMVPCAWLRCFPFQKTVALSEQRPELRSTSLFTWIHDFRDDWSQLERAA